ncbi:hypothetical protein FHS31_000852 [Sphingomonas vulcanisoli]|uniref:Uncharacterized protein n=1 Tax=Sphingomonas vulcanisoli TaxID=1658060 RepID=A0ABX0TUJ5_9SPHN|nr:hypothetical protein [Sphingomonas vulcanisoli]NIJ07256.1 hypothetical protein [Sphingomonas vulcanisoli]
MSRQGDEAEVRAVIAGMDDFAAGTRAIAAYAALLNDIAASHPLKPLRDDEPAPRHPVIDQV